MLLTDLDVDLQNKNISEQTSKEFKNVYCI